MTIADYMSNQLFITALVCWSLYMMQAMFHAAEFQY